MKKNKFNILTYASLIYHIIKDIKNNNTKLAIKKIDILINNISGAVILNGVSEEFMKDYYQNKKKEYYK
jgi:hypothetical protein